MHDREEIARRYGFESFAELLDVSEPLPRGQRETVQSYIARRPNGDWFIWEDAPAPKSAPDKPQREDPPACVPPSDNPP